MTNKDENHISEAERKAFAAVGRLGGKASFRKNGRKHMSEIGKRGADIRWHSKKSKKINKDK